MEEDKKKISLRLTKDEVFILMKAIDIYIFVDSFIGYSEHNEDFHSIKFRIQRNMKLEEG